MSTAREVLLEVLRSEGVEHIFGNPGSTELPLIDALSTVDDIRYVLALQEATAVAMADGYAQVTRRPALLNLHTSAGLGNAIGNLTNAQANRTPLVVTAGQQDYGHIEADPVLSGDLVGLARPIARWSHEVRTPRELGTILRRAFKDAAVAPKGPVFVSLPMSVVDDPADVSTPPRSDVDVRSVAARLDELADLLASAEPGSLAIVGGDEIADADAEPALRRVAELLAAPIYGSPLHASGIVSPTHPLWMGALPSAAAQIRKVLAPYRTVFLAGGQAFRVYPYSDGSPMPDGAALVHLSPDPLEVGRTHPVVLGLVGDLALSLDALAGELERRVDRDRAAARLAERAEDRRREIDRLEQSARARYETRPLHPMAAAHAALRAMPEGSAVVDEAITTGPYVRGFHHWTEPRRYFFTKGGGLGWGMPAALGVSLGYERQVPTLAAVGDGSAMYSPQALWTAAREHLPIVFVVFVNRQYLILKNNLRGMDRDAARSGRFVGLDLGDPEIDYVALAASMGVAAARAESADDVSDLVRTATAGGEPFLVEVPISS
jgi:benzoylformate decarboxylase